LDYAPPSFILVGGEAALERRSLTAKIPETPDSTRLAWSVNGLTSARPGKSSEASSWFSLPKEARPLAAAKITGRDLIQRRVPVKGVRRAMKPPPQAAGN